MATSLYRALVDAGKIGNQYAVLPDQISYEMLITAIDDRAAELSKIVPVGARVAIPSEPVLDFIRDFYALNRLECAVVPQNPDMPEAVWQAHVDYRLFADRVYRCHPGPPQAVLDDIALILFTSGSTGLPKAVYLSNHNLRSNCIAVGQRCFQFENVCGTLTAPLHYVLGLNMQMNLMLLNGGTIFLPQAKNIEAIVHALHNPAVNYISGIPMFYRKVVDYCARHDLSARHLRYAFIGGAPWNQKLVEQIRERLGVVPAATYGLSETSPIVTFGPMTMDVANRLYSVGKAIVDVCIRIGEDGEVLVKGPNVASAVGHPTPQRTDEWFRTGDCGYLDANDNLYITGRIKELINKAGVKINCMLVEQELRRHPEVIDCVVGAVPSTVYGEDIGAVVLASSTLDVGDFSFIKTHQRPKLILNLTEFPTLASSGKIDRKKIQQLLWSSTSSSLTPVCPQEESM